MAVDTKELIAEAVKRLLMQKKVKKLTVKDIVDECSITRQTFYYHFRDIMDVLDWSFRRVTQELAQHSLEAENRIQALSAYVTFVQQNRTKLERLLYSRRWAQIESMLTEAVMIYLAELARGRGKDIGISVDDLEVMLRFYASGMVGILLQYVGKPNLNEEKLVIQMEKIITGKMIPGEFE